MISRSASRDESRFEFTSRCTAYGYRDRCYKGALLDCNAKLPCLDVNIGNGHTLAGIIDDGEIIALMEHHTHQMSSGKLDDLLERLSNGTLGFDEIYDDGGHGCYIQKSCALIISAQFW